MHGKPENEKNKLTVFFVQNQKKLAKQFNKRYYKYIT